MDASERGPGWTTSASDAGMNMFRSQVMLLDGERMSDYHRDANRADSRLQASFVTPGTSTVFPWTERVLRNMFKRSVAGARRLRVLVFFNPK